MDEDRLRAWKEKGATAHDIDDCIEIDVRNAEVDRGKGCQIKGTVEEGC